MQIGGRTMGVSARPNHQHLYETKLHGTDFIPVAFFRLPFDVKMSANGFTDTPNAVDLQLGSNGENVAAMVDYILRRNRDRFDSMEKEARELIPGLQSLSISTPTPQTRRLDLVMEGGCEMPARCLRDACEMPARCLRDACEMPARCLRTQHRPECACSCFS
jgi:hypothetical protein